jgi:hypothetical protein
MQNFAKSDGSSGGAEDCTIPTIPKRSLIPWNWGAGGRIRNNSIKRAVGRWQPKENSQVGESSCGISVQDFGLRSRLVLEKEESVGVQATRLTGMDGDLVVVPGLERLALSSQFWSPPSSTGGL